MKTHAGILALAALAACASPPAHRPPPLAPRAARRSSPEHDAVLRAARGEPYRAELVRASGGEINREEMVRAAGGAP